MRYLTPEVERLFKEEHKMCFIAGPRQVGKTTLAKHLLTRARLSSAYFNWDIESDRTLIHRYPEDFWSRRDTSVKLPFRIALDEIHKFPRWKRFLKGLHDAHRADLEILVTGSGKLGLIDTLVSLLPERIGSPLSINALRKDLGVRFETVQNWSGALARLFYLFSIRPYAGKLARTLRREEKVYLFNYAPIRDPGPRFENLVALHLLKLCSVWTDWGYGDFSLFYVRDREKREVDFLIAQDGKPFALFEVKLSGSEIDPSLRYFTERLKPRYSVQIVRTPDRFKHAFMTQGILIAPATQALAVM